jgi:hypothetical protein
VGTSSGGSQAGTSTGGAGSSSGSPSCPEPDGSTEFQPCGGACRCAAPLICVADAQLQASLCEEPCQVLSDCSSLYAACNGATCSPVLCGPQFDAGFDAACVFDGGIEGSCLPFGPSFGFAFNWQAVGLCSQSGTAALGQSCTPNPTRAVDPGLICAAAAICGPGAADGGVCAPLCDPSTSETCDDAGTCLALEVQAPLLGCCVPTEDAGGPACYPVNHGCRVYSQCCNLNCDEGICGG